MHFPDRGASEMALRDCPQGFAQPYPQDGVNLTGTGRVPSRGTQHNLTPFKVFPWTENLLYSLINKGELPGLSGRRR
jgi:hypothetical protein